MQPEHTATADALSITVEVPAIYGSPDRYRDDVEYIAALALALLAAGARRSEVARRLRGYEPRDGYEVQP